MTGHVTGPTKTHRARRARSPGIGSICRKTVGVGVHETGGVKPTGPGGVSHAVSFASGVWSGAPAAVAFCTIVECNDELRGMQKLAKFYSK